MSVFHFAVSHTRVPSTTANKRHQIARAVGGEDWGYNSIELPEGPRAWGYGPNRGEPFDSRTAREIEAAWKAAGVGR